MGGGLTWGELSLKSEPARATAALLAVTRGPEPSLTVAGAFPAAPGAVVTLDHAGQYTSAYTVRQVVAAGAGTKLIVAEEPGCDWHADTKTSEFSTMPLKSFQGEHTVKLIAATHLQRRATN